ncbi:MAG: SecY-interacting protein Syd [Oscillospiraceae bacterium]|nr:SecY-interacting protein Syd [Oscillospiraceae bacterium]
MSSDVERIKEIIQEYNEKYEQRYGKVELSAPLDEKEIVRWENENSFKLPDEYRDWLKYTGKTVMPFLKMEFYSPSDFILGEDYIKIGENDKYDIVISKIDKDIYSVRDGEPSHEFLTLLFSFWLMDVERISKLQDHQDEIRPVLKNEIQTMMGQLKKALLPESGADEAFGYFLSRHIVSYLNYDGKYPTAVIRKETLDPEMIVAGPNKSGWYQWKPKKITKKIDFEEVESKLGFKVHKEIKEFISSYYYYMIDGSGKGYNFHRYGMTPYHSLEGSLISSFDKGYGGSYRKFVDGQYFHLGSGCIKGDDSYIFEVDNITGEVYAVEYGDKTCIKVAPSLKAFFLNLIPIFEDSKGFMQMCK